MRRLPLLALFAWLALVSGPAAAQPAPTTVPAVETAATPPAAEAESAGSATSTGPAAGTPAAATATAAPADAEASKADAAPAPPPEPTLLVNINLTTQRMVVTENGAPKYTWAVSSGAYGYPTPVGTFNPTWMSKMWYSKQYDNAPMPHAIFFKNGAAIHATSSVRLLGTPASHGCVRLSPSNAAKLFAMVQRHGKARTEIKVHGRPKYTAPRIAKQRATPPRMRYAYSQPYSYGYQPYTAPRYIYPGDAPPRYYVSSNKQRAAMMRKRRAAARQYYSGY
ncbi:MAG: L,D-transpeptidase [Hyphomicrobium sp.]|nr:MAG: L,D-transpeptidase [Hyphomicrobium sp.]